MRVLVTNNTLRDLGGSETYAYTLIDSLNKRDDIEVVGFSQNIGYVGELLMKKNIKITNNPYLFGDNYDLILASHTSTVQYVKDMMGFKIQTCHGIYPSLEQPMAGMDAYVSISEEVKNHLTSLNFNSSIIHNGVDCNRFSPRKELNGNVKKILSLAQSDTLNNTISGVCKKLGIEFIAFNKFINPIFNVEDMINDADLVISLGRGVYESMACGRNVIILDKRPYVNRPPIGDGMITSDNIDLFMKNNCSGRYSNKVFGAAEIEEEINKYDTSYGVFNREYALKNFNIETQIDKYINLMQ